MDLVTTFCYMFALLGAGVGARAVGVLTPERSDYLTRFAFYVALPALVFESASATSLGSVFSVAMVAGFLCALLGVAGIAWVVHRRVPGRGARSVAIVQSYHGNLGFLGLPLVAATLGRTATAEASVLLGVAALVQIPLTLLVLTAMNDADASVDAEFASVARNPVILAFVAGLAVAALGLHVPPVGTTVLETLAPLALPAALVSVGASLALDVGDVELATVGSVVALKVAVMPLFGVAVLTLLAAGATTVRTVAVMLAMPTAVSTFVYANRLGGDDRLASTNVLVTTVVSLGAVFAVLALLG